MIIVKWAQLHAPLFLGGKNHSEKLDPAKTANLRLQYDEKKEWLLVWYNDALGMVPKGSIHTLVPMDILEAGYEKPQYDVMASRPAQTTNPNLNIRAQVSTPMGHVFDGEGAGNSGIGKRLGRPPKAQ